MTRDELERRWDGPIPARELDAMRYPTRAHWIERAKARIDSANRRIRQIMADWRCGRAGFLLTADPEDEAIVTAIFNRECWNIYRYHLRYLRQERLYAQRHLDGLMMEKQDEERTPFKDNCWTGHRCPTCGVQIPLKKPWFYSCSRQDCPVM